MFIPSIEDIYAAHAVAIDRFGGSLGSIPQRETLLISAIQAVENRISYQNETRILFLAALLCIRIANAHAFVDGNKRVAVLSLHLMLEENGIEFHDSRQREFYDLLISTFGGGRTEEQFCEGVVNLLSEP